MNLKPRTSAKAAPKPVEPEEADEEKIVAEVHAESEVEEDAGEDNDDAEEVLDEEPKDEAPVVEEKPVKKVSNAEKVKKFSLKRAAEKAAKEEEEAKSKRIGRNKIIESFKKFLGENVEGMDNLTNESAKQFLESIENWFNSLVTEYSLNFAGFYFGHYQKPCCFREPNGLICFIGPHEEIKAVRVLNEIKKVCSFDKDGKFVAGERGQDAEGNVVVIPNKHDTEYIWPLYKEHLEKVVNNLDKQKEKQKRREEKNLARASNLLK
jgi:hypothetical protein